MNKVSFHDVSENFREIWCESSEGLFHQIAWDCLDKAGLTAFSNEQTYAQVFVYSYVIQMLCNEFSYMAYDEYCSYEYEIEDAEPLTYAAIGWLYRDALDDGASAEECFTSDVHEMLTKLAKIYRYKVADAIFNQLGEDLTGRLLFFSISGRPCEPEPEEDDYFEDEDNRPFLTKEELMEYCRESDDYIPDLLPGYNGMRVEHWLQTHSCALDD